MKRDQVKKLIDHSNNFLFSKTYIVRLNMSDMIAKITKGKADHLRLVVYLRTFHSWKHSVLDLTA